jgi:Predicted beta-xylosidase
MTAQYEGYLFVYFKGEFHPDGEQIYLALSVGNDPLHWQELNGGQPVLFSTLGEQGVRDPFIVRSSSGDGFYLVATDLKIYGNGDWKRAKSEGSRSIMVWKSSDLVHWSEQTMVEIAPIEAGNTWAPEVLCGENGEFQVFWSSFLKDQAESHDKEPYHKVMVATTKDFSTFSKPKIYMDYGKSVIDTTIIEHNGQLYRFSKGDHVFQESGRSFNDKDFKMINDNVEERFMVKGEGPIIFKSNTEEKWYLFIDEHGLRGYLPFETDDLNSGEWNMPKMFKLPEVTRHGSVIPITKAEYERLLNFY